MPFAASILPSARVGRFAVALADLCLGPDPFTPFRLRDFPSHVLDAWRGSSAPPSEPPHSPDAFLGFHCFERMDGHCYGSFEIFYSPGVFNDDGTERGPGYYWWAAFPGCIADGDAQGPFPSSFEAFEDAQAGA